MTEISSRLEAVLRRVREAQSRRVSDAKVTLVAVSKRKPAADIRQALEAGCLDFGENYVQELVDKASELASLAPRWHFIGHLQRNKVKALLGARPLLIHGVDSERLLREIDKRATATTDVLLQVNVSGEEAKSGCAPAEAEPLLEVSVGLPNVRVRGLMTMPPAGDVDAARRSFGALRELAESLGRDRLPELSMGMSGDYEIAIEEGATIVRVGSAVFGPRA